MHGSIHNRSLNYLQKVSYILSSKLASFWAYLYVANWKHFLNILNEPVGLSLPTVRYFVKVLCTSLIINWLKGSNYGKGSFAQWRNYTIPQTVQRGDPAALKPFQVRNSGHFAVFLLTTLHRGLDLLGPPCIFIMRPSSLGGGRILRRTLSVRLTVCLSVCPSVRPSRYRASRGAT